jgi:hypothetical protein
MNGRVDEWEGFFFSRPLRSRKRYFKTSDAEGITTGGHVMPLTVSVWSGVPLST